MDKFVKHTGSAVPLRRSNVDTDQIIPAVYLKRITRTGFEDGLFAAWRSDPEFTLNNVVYENATVLVAGADFGTGSSREHAVWALQNYGFKVVISSRFARAPGQLKKTIGNPFVGVRRKLALHALRPVREDKLGLRPETI